MYTTPTLSEATRITRSRRIARKPAQAFDRAAFKAAKVRVLAEYEARQQAKAWDALRRVAAAARAEYAAQQRLRAWSALRALVSSAPAGVYGVAS